MGYLLSGGFFILLLPSRGESSPVSRKNDWEGKEVGIPPTWSGQGGGHLDTLGGEVETRELPKKRKRDRLTLFNPDVWPPPTGGSDDELDELQRIGTSNHISESELAIFKRLLSEEEPFLPSASRFTMVAGPMIWEEDGDTIDLGRSGTGLFPLPRWVEADGLRLKKCTAKGILAIEKRLVAAQIAKTKAWETFGLLVVGNYGLPTVQARRFIHRVAKDFDLPVFVLADNDTWGYFMFSLLKRGSILPNRDFPFLACPGARYLGFRSGDAERLGLSRCLLAWKKDWDARLNAMAKYPCFKGTVWRKEFDSFRKQNGKLELEAAPLWRDRRQTEEYLDFALRRKDQLS